MRFGYGDMWSPWVYAPDHGFLDCSVQTFGIDPYPDQGKLCMCVQNRIKAVGALWWPTALVALVFFGTHGIRIFALLHHASPASVQALDAVLPVVRIAPMICVVFVAVASRVNAAALQDGLPLRHRGFFGRPAFGVVGLRGTEAAVGLCALALCVLAILRYHAERDAIRTESGETPEAQPQKLCNTLYRWVAIVMYLLILGLLVRIFVISAPSGAVVPFESGVYCAAILASVYFGMYLVILVLTSLRHVHIDGFLLALLKLAALNLNFVPMICALFLALQAGVDSVGAYAPSDVAYLVRMTTVATLTQACLAVVTAVLFDAELEQTNRDTNDLVMPTERNPWPLFILTAIRWAVMVVLIFGLLELAGNLWFLQAARGSRTFLISLLTMAYLFIHLALWITMLHGKPDRSEKSMEIHARNLRNLTKAKDMVDITCPLLAILRVSWWVAGGIDF